MIISWHRHQTTAMQPVHQAIHTQLLDAAVLVCDTYLVFENDTAVHQWATKILNQIDPAYQLTPTAKVEVIVGYHGSQSTLYGNMQDLLHLILSRQGYLPYRHVIKFDETDSKTQHMQIWCGVAIQLYPTQ
ncbi:MAG: hypothetical protein R3D55_07425 [Chloroflexota bacterium]